MKRIREDPKGVPSVARPAPAHRAPPRPVARSNPPSNLGTKAAEQGGRDDRFACPLCLGAITDVVESSCCATLLCQSCAKESLRSNRQCPHCREGFPAPAVDAETGALPPNWTHSRWIQRQIDNAAPKCTVCRINLFAEDRAGHEPQCEGRHAKCFKCQGKGALDFARTDGDDNSDDEETVTIRCDACAGNQFLKGLKWTKCTKCRGRGEIFFLVGQDDVLCDACCGRGALQGLDWMTCFRCSGRGGINAVGGDMSRCVGCKGRGQLKGKDWTACVKCKGQGQHNALNGSRVVCNACTGHGALRGLDWERCFNCHGKGAYNGDNGAHFCCHACSGKGALRGEYTKCFKCQGKGTTESSDGHYRVPCNTCATKGALQGRDWTKCPSCNGCGYGGTVHKDCAQCVGLGVLKGLLLSN